MRIDLGKTYNVKVWDDTTNEYWFGTFTPDTFLTTGTYAGAYSGIDNEGWPAIVEPEEFVSEV